MTTSNANQAVDAGAPAATAAPGPIRQRGTTLLKIWGVLYLAVVVGYGTHCWSGAEYVALQDLRPGRRIWTELTFERAGERVDLAEGETLSRAVLEGLATGTVTQGAFVQRNGDWVPADPDEPNAGPLHAHLYRSGTFHALPWATMLGVLNFAGLALLLYTFVGDMVPVFLDAQAAQVRADLEAARAAQAEAKALHAKRDAAMAELETERETLKVQAETDAQHEHARLVAEAKKKAKHMTEALGAQLQADAHAAMAELRARLAARLVAKARAELSTGVDDATQGELVRGFVRQLRDMELS